MACFSSNNHYFSFTLKNTESSFWFLLTRFLTLTQRIGEYLKVIYTSMCELEILTYNWEHKKLCLYGTIRSDKIMFCLNDVILFDDKSSFKNVSGTQKKKLWIFCVIADKTRRSQFSRIFPLQFVHWTFVLWPWPLMSKHGLHPIKVQHLGQRSGDKWELSIVTLLLLSLSHT